MGSCEGSMTYLDVRPLCVSCACSGGCGGGSLTAGIRPSSDPCGDSVSLGHLNKTSKNTIILLVSS